MSQPRIISGCARGIRLASVPGDSTRPITDRVKESLFNIISTDIVNSIFLDLFGGTGSVGIEALSRGAHSCLFLELDLKAISVIYKNLEKTKTAESARVLHLDALKFLSTPQNQCFDYVYIAPPQYKAIWKKALSLVDSNESLLSNDSWVIVQIHPIEYETLALDHLVEFDKRKYGSTLLVFYQKEVTPNPR